MMNDFLIRILEYLLGVPVVLFALTFHEVSHGLVASWLGDDTARRQGRLTLNPLRHLDPIGFICMVLFHFGWAKPVPINARNFKNPKAGMAISALAGPVSNILLAFVNLLILEIANAIRPEWYLTIGPGSSFLSILYYVLFLAVQINLTFAIFNLIPIPPLDGSRVLLAFLPQELYFRVMRYERTIMLCFFGFILLDSYVLPRLFGISILSTVLGYGAAYLYTGMLFLIRLLPFIP